MLRQAHEALATLTLRRLRAGLLEVGQVAGLVVVPRFFYLDIFGLWQIQYQRFLELLSQVAPLSRAKPLEES